MNIKKKIGVLALTGALTLGPAAIPAGAVTVSDRLLKALAHVESRTNDRAVGDHGKAAGRYQIRKIYIRDVNRITRRKAFTYADRRNADRAAEAVRIYLSYWGERYEKETGRKATDLVLARIHNGGPFWRKCRNPSLDAYAVKVRVALLSLDKASREA